MVDDLAVPAVRDGEIASTRALPIGVDPERGRYLEFDTPPLEPFCMLLAEHRRHSIRPLDNRSRHCGSAIEPPRSSMVTLRQGSRLCLRAAEHLGHVVLCRPEALTLTVMPRADRISAAVLIAQRSSWLIEVDAWPQQSQQPSRHPAWRTSSSGGSGRVASPDRSHL